jgi:hypothetical protein
LLLFDPPPEGIEVWPSHLLAINLSDNTVVALDVVLDASIMTLRIFSDCPEANISKGQSVSRLMIGNPIAAPSLIHQIAAAKDREEGPQ